MTHRATGDRLFDVRTLARVEGEGAMHVRVSGDEVTAVELRIYEPPRLFEAFLRGRAWTEPPDITSRICGICPVAYQMSACQALEQACGVSVSDEVRRMRRLLYCGEWIESHALHVYFLHLPDFLRFDGVVDMARAHPDVAQQGLRLKKAGNAIMSVVGGRAVHPINVRVGGFYAWPTREALAELQVTMQRARDDAVETVRLVSGLDFPDFEQPHEYVALRADNGDYPLEAGAVVTSSGLHFEADEFDGYVTEEQVPWSNALHARMDGVGNYVVGPLARYSLNSDALSQYARQLAHEAGLEPECRNPFRSIVVRAVELVQVCDEAVRLIDSWQGAGPSFVDVPPRAGVGYGVTEAPRGLLYHRYQLAEDGTILDAAIVPPTSQNQASTEADLRSFVQERLYLSDDELTRQCEQAIRNYDPCISCATHFLDLTVDRH